MSETIPQPSVMTRIGWRLEALAWDTYLAWYKAKGIDRASDAAGELLQRIGPMTPVHNVARINMQRCFPEAERSIDFLLPLGFRQLLAIILLLLVAQLAEIGLTFVIKDGHC